MNNECGYEQQENYHASQSNDCSTDSGSFLNPDVLENSGEICTDAADPESCFAVFQLDC